MLASVQCYHLRHNQNSMDRSVQWLLGVKGRVIIGRGDMCGFVPFVDVVTMWSTALFTMSVIVILISLVTKNTGKIS